MPTYVCPTCSKTLRVESRGDAPFRPFCSERCKMVDLAKWFDEEYRIELPLTTPLPFAPSASHTEQEDEI